MEQLPGQLPTPPVDSASMDQGIRPSARRRTKGPWSKTEDLELLLAMRVCGPNSWTAIAERMPGRSAKQCRERYHQNLAENLCHDPISPAEGRWIMEYVSHHGRCWANIARLMGNRSDNAIKNWWHGERHRLRKQQERLKSGAHDATGSHDNTAWTPSLLSPFQSSGSLPATAAATSASQTLPSMAQNIQVREVSGDARNHVHRTLLPPADCIAATSRHGQLKTQVLDSRGHSPCTRTALRSHHYYQTATLENYWAPGGGNAAPKHGEKLQYAHLSQAEPVCRFSPTAGRLTEPLPEATPCGQSQRFYGRTTHSNRMGQRGHSIDDSSDKQTHNHVDQNDVLGLNSIHVAREQYSQESMVQRPPYKECPLAPSRYRADLLEPSRPGLSITSLLNGS